MFPICRQRHRRAQTMGVLFVMDMFAHYAAQAIPASVQRKQAKAENPPSALELKMLEKQRLSRAYRASRRVINKETLADEPRLLAFARYLKKADPAELVEAISQSWLPTAPENVKHYALRLVTARCDKINRSLGFEALDDPLPPETSTFFKARAALGVR